MDFGDELGVEDWRGIIDEFVARADEDYEDLTRIDLEEETDQQTLKPTYALTVVCASEADRAKLEVELIERDEVLDVAYKR